MLKRVFSRGLLYSIGTLCNRIIPESLFRFRVFQVFELHPSREQRISGARSAPTPADELKFRWCETADDFASAEELTFYQPPAISGDRGSDQPIQNACLAEDWARPVGGVWVGTQFFDETELGIRIRLAENGSWIFAAFVAKSHRRRGVYRRLIDHVLTSRSAECKDAVVFASINPTNKASMAAHRPFVHRTVGTCVVCRILSWSLGWANGGLSIDRSKRPIELIISQVGN